MYEILTFHLLTAVDKIQNLLVNPSIGIHTITLSL